MVARMFCPHCGRSIDDQSRFCQFCGTSLSPVSHQPVRQDDVTIRNPKRGKILQIVGVFVMLLGVITFCSVGTNIEQNGAVGFGVLFVFVGGVLFYAGRFTRWYHWK